MHPRKDKGEPTITCDFTMMETEQRERYRALRHQLSKDLHEVRRVRRFGAAVLPVVRLRHRGRARRGRSVAQDDGRTGGQAHPPGRTRVRLGQLVLRGFLA
jgi:hypothetical protein